MHIFKKNIHDNIKSSIVWKGTHFWGCGDA